jgi:hypothetical protein
MTMARPVLLYVLMFGMGALWLVAYVLIIVRGFREKTFGVPVAALCANISWEFVFSFVQPHYLPQRAADILWFCFDVVILCQLLRWGPRDFPNVSKAFFYATVGFALISGFAIVLLMTHELKNYNGAYAGFGINLMMSILFIAMLCRRGSLRGQSIGIASSKMLGTVCASLLFLCYVKSARGSVLLPFLFVATFILDLVYWLLLVFWERLAPIVLRPRRERW